MASYDWKSGRKKKQISAIKSHEDVRAKNQARKVAANAPKKPSNLQTTGMKMSGGSRDFEREKSRRNSSKWDTYRTSRDFLKMSKGKTKEQVNALSKIASQGQTGRETRSTQRSAAADTQRNTMTNARFKRDNMTANARAIQANESERLSLVDKFKTEAALLQRDKFQNDVYNQDFYTDADGIQHRRSTEPHPGQALSNTLMKFKDPKARKEYFDSLTSEQKQHIQGWRGLQSQLAAAKGSMPLRPSQAGATVTTGGQKFDSWRSGVRRESDGTWTDATARNTPMGTPGYRGNSQLSVISDTGTGGVVAPEMPQYEGGSNKGTNDAGIPAQPILPQRTPPSRGRPPYSKGHRADAYQRFANRYWNNHK